MNSKSKFPLPLASVVQTGGARKPSSTVLSSRANSAVTATPQTATKNAAQQSQLRQMSADKGHDLKRTAGGALSTNIMQKSSPTSPAPNTQLAPAVALASEKIRQAMVARVAQKGVKDESVLGALEAVQRHLFIESGLASQAYIDASLPIGYHQTISQPYIVARMIEVMRNGKPMDKVLEIGTGCGYQAAVLSLVAKEVYSIERIKGLHELAKANLRPMRIANIRLHYGDGILGLPQVAPFDGIILAAAGLEIPQALLDQLKIGGRLVGPVGTRHQMLQLVQRISQYEWQTSVLEPCHFVPLHHGVI